ncbi:MAG: pyruvate kinase [Pontibacterium sp.]
MYRRTKIVATLGPASESAEQIEGLVKAGADVFRLNFSHGEPAEHKARAENVRAMAKKHGRVVAILGDLQGPKIRISRFKDKKVTLDIGQTFVLDAELGRDEGDAQRVGIDYKELVADSSVGDILLLDDGRIRLEVTEVFPTTLTTKVIVGGPLSNNKGINRLGGGLSAHALTDKDKEDIKTAAAIGVDYLAVSFPRSADDMNEARALLAETGATAGLVAKIERAEAVYDHEVLDEIILASDAVMVARGDLAVEIGDAALVGTQKHIIARARTLNRVVITATQMMESMITSPMPTRAEVSDVANAVFDYTDAVMLSAETAAGDYPVEAVEAMVRVILGAEAHPDNKRSKHRLHEEFNAIDETIALSAMYAANHLKGVKAIVCLTESGQTPMQMSRLKSSVPIFAMSGYATTLQRTALYRGVQPLAIDVGRIDIQAAQTKAFEMLKEANAVSEGDLVVFTTGNLMHTQGGTDALHISRV